MIIRRDETSLLLITQPDHAALARRMMAHWVSRGFPQHDRLDSLLHAVEAHDNGWREVDAAPLVGDDGSLQDFVTAPVEIRQSIWPRGVRRLSADPIAAALVAEHAIYIYRRFADDAAWRGFFTEMEILRDELTAGAGLDAATLSRDYFFLRVADLMSLVFCNGWTEPQELDDHRVWLDGDTLIVDPDPFAGGHIRIDVPARVIPHRIYASADDAWVEWEKAERVMVRGRLRGA